MSDETPLKRARQQRHWTQEAVLARLEDYSHRHGIKVAGHSSLRTRLSAWENGRQTPSRHYQVPLQAVFGKDTYLGFPEPQADDDQNRIRHVQQRPSSLDEATIDAFDARIQDLEHQYHSVRSTGLIADAGHVYTQIEQLCREAPASALQERLVRTHGRAATMMAQLTWDASQRKDNAGALAYLGTAERAATESGDTYTRAYADLRRSYVALYGTKDPAAGAVAAARAASRARRCSRALTVLATLHVAEAKAMLGQQRECHEHLDAARALFDRVADDDPAWAHCSTDEIDRMAGSSYLALHDHPRAEATLRSVAASMKAKQKSSTIVLSNLALTLIRQGRVDEGIDTVHQTITAIEAVRGGGGLNLVFRAGRELQAWRSEPRVVDVTDRLFGLMAA